MKRVVVTSSIAAVAFSGKPRTLEVVVDESWYSDPNFCRDSKMWYILSKTLVEEAAWKFAKDKGIDMVTINPAMVIGPLLQPTLNTSAAAVLNLINGATTYQVSKEKTQSLGVNYNPLKDGLKDTVESLKEKFITASTL